MDNKIKILLVDDEEDALELLEHILYNRENVQVVGKASDKKNAISEMIIKKPDVIFQDIQMHDISGIELVDEYRKLHYKGKIVFVTAYADYAIDAIKKDAFDYLLKPVDPEELDELIMKLLSKKLKLQVKTKSSNRKLKIPIRSGISFVNKGDIVYSKANGNYTEIVKSDGEQLTTSRHLGRIEEELAEGKFFRISRSAIINIDYLEGLNRGQKECSLQVSGDLHTLRISSQKAKELENLL